MHLLQLLTRTGSTVGSRHSARGPFNMFPSISRLFPRWRGPQQWRAQEFFTGGAYPTILRPLTKIIRAAFIVNLLRLVPSLGLLPPLFWVICTLMTFNLTSTALLPTPSLPLGQ